MRRAAGTISILGMSVLGSHASPAFGQRTPTVSLVDSTYLAIGSVDGPAETTFAGIVGAVRLSDGTIAVGDGGAHAIRFFDSHGTHLRSVGREGEGPGEFKGLWWIGLCPNDEVLLADAIVGRATILDGADGSIIRTFPLPSWLLFNRYLACAADGDLVILLNQPRELGTKGNVTRFPARLARFAPGSDTSKTLGIGSGTDYYFASKVGGYSPVPLGSATLAASNHSRAYLGQNTSDSIQVFGLESGSHASFTHALPRPELTRARWEAAKETLIERAPLARTRTLLTQVLAEMPAPESHPAYLDMKADRSGRLWLQIAVSSNTSTWRVLDPNGRALATIILPANVEPLDIGDTFLVGVARDTMNVQSIRVYTFTEPYVRRSGN